MFDDAGVEKPDGQMAHAFRHYFVTVCYRDYGMDPSTIKHLIGYSDASTVMETTYQHLTDHAHVDAAREATGMETDASEESDQSLTPETCPTCNEPLPPNAKACPYCGMVFTPDAVAAQDAMQEKVRETKEEAETLGEYKDADKIAQALEDDPKFASQLMDYL